MEKTHLKLTCPECRAWNVLPKSVPVLCACDAVILLYSPANREHQSPAFVQFYWTEKKLIAWHVLTPPQAGDGRPAARPPAPEAAP